MTIYPHQETYDTESLDQDSNFGSGNLSSDCSTKSPPHSKCALK